MTPTVDLRYGVDVLEGLAALPAGSVHCVVTSPPYFSLRSYLDASHPDKAAELGGESSPDCLVWARGEPPCGRCFVCNTVAWLRAVWRVLRDDGVVFLNLGDSYSSTAPGTVNSPQPKGSKADAGQWARLRPTTTLPPKSLMLIPARVALAAQADGWIVRQDIIWAKTAPMPESVTDRFTKSHEHVFMLAKQGRYYFDAVAVAEQSIDPEGSAKRYESAFGGAKADALIGDGFVTQPKGMRVFSGTRNRRDVLLLNPDPYPGAHFATMPRDLARICIMAGSSAAGCCPKCQAPYVRDVESGELAGEKRIQTGARPAADIRGVSPTGLARTNGRTWRERIVGGWRPSCTCNAGLPIPATILDPFSGSGTTASVAKQCGRSAIGIDLNAAYLPLAEDRVAGVTAPMVPAGYEDAAPVATNGDGWHEHAQQELFA